MDASTIHGIADARLLAWLARSGVRYVIHEHGAAFTARGAALAEAIDPHTFAKVVGVETETGHRMLIVVEATDQVDLHKARVVLGSKKLRLLTEPELAAIAPGCEVGAMPAVGLLYDLPMMADDAIRRVNELSFNAGSHRVSVRMDRAGWEHAAGVMYADLAQDPDTTHVWGR